MFKHVIFDWSGTLCDDHQVSYLATNECLHKMAGVNITYEEYKQEFTLPVTPFYEKYGIFEPIDVLNTTYFEIYRNHYHKGVLFDGVIDSLQYLKEQGVSCSVFSTLDQEQLTDNCHRKKIAQYFCHIHGSVCDKTIEMDDHLKQIPQVPKDQIIFFGDMNHDIEAGNQHGLISAAVLNGYHNKEMVLAAHPKHAFEHQKEWMDFFMNHHSA